MRKPVGEAHLALVAPGVIARLPVADADRRVDKTVGGPQPRFEPGEVDKRLERRAGLALRLGRAVELALVVVAAADHGLDRAVGRHRDERALADRVPGAVFREHLGDRRFCRILQLGVERRLDDEVAVAGAGKIADLLGEPVGEVARAGAARLRERGALLFGAGGVGGGDRPGLDHQIQDLRGARHRLVAVALRVEAGRRLQQPCDDGALEQVELLRRLAEIAVRGGVDAIGPGAEIDAVEIDFEDLVLGEAALEPQREKGLAELAGEAALRCQKKDFRELLGDRAAALDDPAGAQIGHRGADEAKRVDAEMAVEAAVLGGDDRRWQRGRHLIEPQRLAKEIAKAGDKAAVRGEDRHRRAALGQGQVARVGQRQGKIAERAAADDEAPQHEKNGELYRAAQKAAAAWVGSGRGAARRALVRRRRAVDSPARRGRPQPLVRIDAQRRRLGHVLAPKDGGAPCRRARVCRQTVATVRQALGDRCGVRNLPERGNVGREWSAAGTGRWRQMSGRVSESAR